MRKGLIGLHHEILTNNIIGAAIDVHKQLGPGLLESIYDECLCAELSLRRIKFERKVEIPIVYKGMNLAVKYEMDIVVDKTVVLELKAVDALSLIHEAQLMTYLRLSKLKVGLLINFNVAALKDGIKRRVL